MTRRQKAIAFFVALCVLLVAAALSLNIGWIVINARRVTPLVFGVLSFALIIAGLIVYTVFLVLEIKRNEEHDSFINAVTHELKTPIASIRLYLQTLQSRDVDESRRRHFYQIMLADADRLHHTVDQQIEILSRTVMKPLDRRAESHVRTAVLRAFGITAISPTALSDAIFFLACGVRMVRGIAASYGHRPTAAATIHLLRRLLLEAGKLGAVDIASTSLIQHLGGAVTERFATTTADALYASYRMARLGIIVMDLCRPIPFRDDDVPSVASLVGNVVKRRSEEGR